MLSIPPQGINVLSAPPPSADNPPNPKHRQLFFITLNDQILSQIQASRGKGITVTFGQNPGIQIGNEQVHKFSTVSPEAQSAPFEVYRQKRSSSNPKLDLLGRVTHKIQVRRGLDSSSMDKLKNRTEEAERERNSRKAVLLEKPPPTKRTPSLHARHNSSNSRAFLAVLDNKPGVKGSGVRSLPSSPLLRPTAGSSAPKYLPIGGSPRIAPLSSPRLPPASPKPSPISLRTRLIHMLALGASSEQVLQERTRAVRSELTTCLQDIARKVAPGSTQWELKDESYRDLKPKEWKNYTSQERDMVEKKQKEVVARLPAIGTEPKITAQITEIPKKRTESEAIETPRPVVMTPRAFDSPVATTTTPSRVPAKRPAEDEAENPVRKVGGAIITSKKKAGKAISKKETSTTKPTVREQGASSPASSKISPPKKARDSSKYKSEEKVVDSDSDSDVPLETQIKSVTPSQRSHGKASSSLKGLGITTIEPEPKRQHQVMSPPVSNTNRSRTSSSSSSHSYSPPKKRSPLATNEPVTARRAKSPAPPSPPPSGKKRSREEETSRQSDKRQKIQIPETRPSIERSKSDSAQLTKRDIGEGVKISPEHHDMANRFRKLYPEYQELHRRLQGLDEDRLSREKSNVDKLIRMQEQLQKWKATLWKVAGESRHIGTARVGVKV